MRYRVWRRTCKSLRTENRRNIYNWKDMTNRLPRCFGRRFVFILKFSFPKSVEVAVSINCNRFIFAGAKGSFRCISRFKSSPLTSVLRFKVNPLNIMLLSHRMRCFADPDINRTVFQIHKRQVLFSRRFGGVRNQRLHLLSAAHHRNPCIVNKTD